MSYNTSPSFAVGGVPYLDHMGQPGDADVLPREGGWRCYHCGGWFTGWRAASRHFGDPGSKVTPLCQAHVYTSEQRNAAVDAINNAGWSSLASITARRRIVDLVAITLGLRLA